LWQVMTRGKGRFEAPLLDSARDLVLAVEDRIPRLPLRTYDQGTT
jgi:hypothetical protein